MISDNSSADQEISRPCGTRIHKSPPLDPVLSHLNPVHTVTYYLLKTHFNFVLPFLSSSSKWSLPFRFSGRFLLCIYHLIWIRDSSVV